MPSIPYYVVLQYAGGGFAGWQRQPDQRTVQAELESALQRIAGGRVITHAAGRTDAGVHALGQFVSFLLPRPWESAALARALRALTPDDIWVAHVAAAPAGFNARRDATARRYRYVIGTDAAASSPFRRPYEWAVRHPLEGRLLAAAAAALVGRHDFRAFAAAGSAVRHHRCDVRECAWQTRPDAEGFILHVEADRFLHRMVRFMVGTMVDVASRRRPLEDVAQLLEHTNNDQTSPPAPPHGLYFVTARYPQLAEALDQ